jgi:hypothetical protein
METDKRQPAAGKRCQLLKPIPDRQGKLHFNEAPIILRELINLGRRMFLIQFEDGSTTFVFPSEVIVQAQVDSAYTSPPSSKIGGSTAGKESLSKTWMKKRMVFSSAVNSRLDPELTMTAIINLDEEYRPTRATLVNAGVHMTDSMDALYRDWRRWRDRSKSLAAVDRVGVADVDEWWARYLVQFRSLIDPPPVAARTERARQERSTVRAHPCEKQPTPLFSTTHRPSRCYRWSQFSSFAGARHGHSVACGLGHRCGGRVVPVTMIEAK